MIDKKTANQAKEILGTLDRTVKLVTFIQEMECVYCKQTIELVEEISGLSDKVMYEVYDLVEDSKVAEKYGIDKIPAIAVVTEKEDYGIRFFGIPSGYEFVSLLEAIKLVSTGKHELAEETVKKLESIDMPVHIQVFVTATCPYCPRAVMLAHKFAYVSGKIKGDMVEAIEFPHLANKYNVMGVPRSVFNEQDFIEGSVPEKVFADKVVEVGGKG